MPEGKTMKFGRNDFHICMKCIAGKKYVNFQSRICSEKKGVFFLFSTISMTYDVRDIELFLRKD